MKPKRYKLKKDLPTFMAGDEFELTPYGALVQIINGRIGVCAYAASTLEKFPCILTDWFEEIKPKEPRITDEDARDAVFSWASALQIHRVECTRKTTALGVEVITLEAYDLHSAPKIEFSSIDADVENRTIYTITELCGEGEE